MDIRGCWTAIVTPFTAGGEQVDRGSLEQLVQHQIRAGVSGLVVCGSTGEAVTLTDVEYDQTIRDVVLFARKQVPIIAGVGASATARTVSMAEDMKARGVDGILVVAPPYNKPPQAGIIEHVKATRAAARLPVVLYNIPGRASVNILPQTVATLFAAGEIVAVKESSGSIDQVSEILALTDGALSVLSGEDTQVLPVIACGGQGVISASANVAPRNFVTLTNAARSGDFATARREQYQLLPLIKAMFMETNPIPAKEALRQQGIIAHHTVRLPLLPAAPATAETFMKLLPRYARADLDIEATVSRAEPAPTAASYIFPATAPKQLSTER